MQLEKVQVKVRKGNTEMWVHFCYVPKHIKDKFEKETASLNKLSNDWVLKWAAEDFGYTPLETIDDLMDLRCKIKNYYKEKYPELYLGNTNTDRQGWIRVWYTNHMVEELKYV